MSDHLGRKVDQLLGFADRLMALVDNTQASQALASAVCWQLEQALCCYLLELVRSSGNRKWTHQWTLNEAVITDALQAVPSADLQELADLGRAPGTWLYRLHGYLRELRAVDDSRSLKGEIFQSDLASGSGTALIASSQNFPISQEPELKSLAALVEECRALVVRQRTGHVEY